LGKKGLLFFICMLIIVVACVYKYNQFMAVDKVSTEEDLSPASSIAISEEEANKISNMTPIRLYFLSKDIVKLRQEIRYIPDAQAKKGNEYLSSVIINELIKGPIASSKLRTLLPKTTTINSVKVNGSEVVVDISKSFFYPPSVSTQSPQATGSNTANTANSEVTSIMMYSIIDSLTECEGISDVTFKVDGNADAQELKDLNIQGVQKRRDDIIDRSVNSK